MALTELTPMGGLIALNEAKRDALVRTDPAAKLLQTVPSVGPRTAEAIAAHLD